MMRVIGRGARAQLTFAAAAVLLVGLIGVGSATAEKPVRVEAGNLVFTFNGGFKPKALPKQKMAPIALTASGKIQTKDGTHPPALKEAIVETDKNGTINVTGLAVCKSGQLQSRATRAAEKACRKSIIGTGRTTVEVQFPEQRPIDVDSKLLVLNGGKRGGTTTLYIHAYFSAPVTGAIVTTVKIKKVKNGRYGLKSVATIPKIAGGSGSVKTFNLKIDRKYTFKGKRMSVLSARCRDGKLQAKATAVLADGTRATGTILRTCNSRG
jgi:hypothetical protein